MKFSEIEIKKFEKIYNNEPIEESEISELEAEKEKLNRKNEESKNYMGHTATKPDKANILSYDINKRLMQLKIN